MTPDQAIAFVCGHGVVLEASRGAVPSLADAIAEGPIKGKWWSHPKSREIFSLTRFVRDHDDILVCRMVDGKITFVHRRLWPALVRLAGAHPYERLARIREEHTPSGRHAVRMVAYPQWVSEDVSRIALAIGEAEARAQLGAWIA